MQINQLPVTGTFNDSTVIPVENGNVTSQVSGATLKAAMIDGAVTGLPSVATYDDDIEFAVASDGVTSKMTGAVLRSAIINTIKNVVVEIDSIPSFTVPANSVTPNTFTVSHSKSGYICYLLYCTYAWSGATWACNIKNSTPNVAAVEFANKTGSSHTFTNTKAVWLCIPNS